MTAVPLDVETLEALERRELTLAEAFGIPSESLASLEKRGLGLYHQGRYAECVAVFELLEGLGRENAATSFLLAACADRLGNLAAAQRHFAVGERQAIAAKDTGLIDLARAWANTKGAVQ